MTVPASKAELLAAITTTFDALIADLSNVPAHRTRERSLDGHAAGTRMSLADLVSYLVGWNELVLKWLDQDDRGAEVAQDAGWLSRHSLRTSSATDSHGGGESDQSDSGERAADHPDRR
jgi:hypothetical protein